MNLRGPLPLILSLCVLFTGCNLLKQKTPPLSTQNPPGSTAKIGTKGNGQGFGGGDVILTALTGILLQMKFSLSLITQANGVETLCEKASAANDPALIEILEPLDEAQRASCNSLLRVAAPELIQFIPPISDLLFVISNDPLEENLPVLTVKGPAGKIYLHRDDVEGATPSMLMALATRGLLQKIMIAGQSTFLSETDPAQSATTPLLLKAVGAALAAYSLVHPESGGGVWSPASIGRIAGWLRAESLTGKFRDGETITTLMDVTGNQFDGVQYLPLKRPFFREKAANNLPGLEFREGQGLSLPPLPRMTRTLVVAHCPGSIYGSVLFSVGSPPGWMTLTYGSFVLGGLDGLAGTPNNYSENGETIRSILDFTVTPERQQRGVNCRTSSLVMTQTRTAYYLNGTLLGDWNLGLTEALTPTTLGYVNGSYLGPRSNPGVTVMELLLYSDALSDEDRALAENYLKEKYDLE